MQSIFHIRADTASEFREELVKWLDDRAAQAERSLEYKIRTRSTRVARATKTAELHTYRAMLDFWRDLVIDPKEP